MTDHLKYIEKLNGDNYGIWKIRMKALLVHKGFWKCVRPSDVESNANNNLSASEQTRGENVDDIANRQPSAEDAEVGKSQQALSLIILALEDSQIIHVDECSSGKEAWSKLQKLYEEPSTANKMRLYEKFLTMKMEKEGTVRAHVQEFSSIRSQLRSVSVNIDDSLYKLALLRSLSHKYEHLVVTLENQVDAMNVEDIHARIYREEVRQECSEEKLSQALSAQVKPVNRGMQYSRQVKCFYCDKKGHIKADCWKRKQNEERNTSHYSHGFQNNDGSILMALESQKKCNQSTWYIDSGASFHICNNKELFKDILRELKTPKKIELGNGEVITVTHEGDLDIQSVNKFGKYQLNVKNVLYMPQSAVNLLSVAQITKREYAVIFFQDECKIVDPKTDRIIIKLAIEGTGYKFNATPLVNTNCMLHSQSQDDEDKTAVLWHKRFAHAGTSTLLESKKDGRLRGGPPIDTKFDSLANCVTCDKGKMTNQPYGSVDNRVSDLLELIHTDVCGPMKIDSIGKTKYFVIYVDDKSRMTFTYFIRSKSEVQYVTRKFVNLVERQSGKKVKRIRSDNGSEYVCSKLQDFFDEKGIKHERSAPYTPQQNGLAERTNRILIEKARCMMAGMNLPARFWAEAVATATYLKNVTPTATLNWITPHEAYYDHTPVVSHLKVFGCKAQVFIPPSRRGKWEVTSEDSIFIGYTDTTRIFRFYSLSRKKVFTSAHARFYEDVAGWTANGSMVVVPVNLSDIIDERILQEQENLNAGEQVVTHNNVDENEQENDQQFDEQPTDEHQSTLNQIQSGGESSNSQSIQSPENSTEEINSSENQMTRSGRVIRTPARLTYDYCVTDDEDQDVATMYTAFEPLSYEEAVNVSEREGWIQAMREEMHALKLNKTWELVDPPQGQKVIQCRWVFNMKHASDDSNPKFKARLVAKGFHQSYGVDYFDTYAPVARLSSIRLLLALAVNTGAHIHQMDVRNAFLNGELSETVYMRQPEGFIDQQYPSRVFKLRRTLYGLKQAAREWYKTITIFLNSIGFSNSKSDQAIYFATRDNVKVWLVLYVDDILIISTSTNAINDVMRVLSKEYRMKDVGKVNEFLGITIDYDRNEGTMTLSQSSKIEKMIKRFGMENCKGVATPLDKSYTTFLNQNRQLTKEAFPYREAIGCLLYLAMCTHPDISYSVTFLSKFCEEPTAAHWVLVKRVFRYLRETSNYQLQFFKSSNANLYAYSDADWGSLPDRKSTSGTALFYGDCLVSWKAKRQTVVALSTTEAEMIAVTDTFKELKLAKKILHEIFQQVSNCTILCDNQPCITIANGNGYSGRAKHIDLKYLAVQDYVSNGEFKLEYCGTNDMKADIMTKALVKQTHHRLMSLLHLTPSQ